MIRLALFLLMLPALSFGQGIDTLRVQSEAFGTDRTVLVHTPADYRYQSDAVELPVIYVLDGQHEWFVNPVLNQIEYLRYVYEIPSALVVVIPHENRNTECAIGQDGKRAEPLFNFITRDLEGPLAAYHPNDYRVIIGHSLSASFALHAFERSSGFFSGVFAHTPMDRLEEIATALEHNPNIDLDAVCIATGSPDHDKDMHHREAYEQVKANHPELFLRITLCEADLATHNAVPMVCNPLFLSKLFYNFSRRYGHIAEVDLNYKLRVPPGEVEDELKQVQLASYVGNHPYVPEIGELFGLASRYQNSGYAEHALAVYQWGMELYPHLCDFPLTVYYLVVDTDPELAKAMLLQAESIAGRMEVHNPEYDGIFHEIQAEKEANGWD